MAVMAMMLSACSNGNYENKAAADKLEKTEAAFASDAGRIAADTAAGQVKFTTPQITPTHQDWDKKIIKTANITLELKNYKEYNHTLHAGIKAYGAYIAAEEQTQDDYRISNSITIKVPVEQFDNLVSTFSGDGITMIEKKIGTEDVTGEVVDTRSRIEAKKQVRDRYLGLLKQARNMKEILEVQREINGIQEDLESAAGRVNYLTHQSAYSTINLAYFQFLTSVPRTDPGSFGVRLKDSLDTGLQIIGNLLIFIVSLWPVWSSVAIGMILWKRRKTVKQ